MAPLNLENKLNNESCMSIISRMLINVNRVTNRIAPRINVFPHQLELACTSVVGQNPA